MDYKKIEFLTNQKLEVLKRLGNPIQLSLWREYRKKLATLTELIKLEQQK